LSNERGQISGNPTFYSEPIPFLLCDPEVVISAARPLPNESDLRMQITDAFPPEPYHGQVTPADGMDWTEELDDDIELWQFLAGKSWTSVPDEFVDRHRGNLVLLTPGAFSAFLPAWLIRGFVNPEVRQFTIYTFVPHPHPALKEHWHAHISHLRPEQIACVRQFLLAVRDHDEQHNRVQAAIALQVLPH
jgi:hypothetical protein